MNNIKILSNIFLYIVLIQIIIKIDNNSFTMFFDQCEVLRTDETAPKILCIDWICVKS